MHRFMSIMDTRFPLQEAPNPSARKVIESCIATMNLDHSVNSWFDERTQALRGPYAALSYSPYMVEPLFVSGRMLYNHEICKPRNRELAIMGLLSLYDAPVIAAEHRHIAAQIGISSEQFGEGLAGNEPTGLSEEECMAYKLGRILPTLRGPLEYSIWKEVNEKMPKSELVGVCHIVGGYRWMTLLEQIGGV
ncbi:hypothetical protein F5Y10DRAFT_237657 [Nemania abortiva]|nr:hypothetical protein F5Y10DRAFT_237657 [Nemania abortiva]